jgi:hypothetical protein
MEVIGIYPYLGRLYFVAVPRRLYSVRGFETK